MIDDHWRGRLKARHRPCPARRPSALSVWPVHNLFRQRSRVQCAVLRARSPVAARGRGNRACADRSWARASRQGCSARTSRCSSGSASSSGSRAIFSSPTTARSTARRSISRCSHGAIHMKSRCGRSSRCCVWPPRNTSSASRRSPAPCSSPCRWRRSSCRPSAPTRRATAEWKGPDASMFELSRTQNIIHIVLDAFQSDFFGEILNEDRKELDQQPVGRRVFRQSHGRVSNDDGEHSGDAHGNGVSPRAAAAPLRARHFDKGSLFKSLRAHGYRVDNIADIVYDTKSAIERLSDAASVYRIRRVRSICRLAACRSVVVPARASHAAGRTSTTTRRGGFKHGSAPAIPRAPALAGQRFGRSARSSRSA